MHFEVTPTNRDPLTFYKVIVKTDTGRPAAAISITSTGALAIFPADGFSLDSWTNDEQTESRVEIKEHAR